MAHCSLSVWLDPEHTFIHGVLFYHKKNFEFQHVNKFEVERKCCKASWDSITIYSYRELSTVHNGDGDMVILLCVS